MTLLDHRGLIKMLDSPPIKHVLICNVGGRVRTQKCTDRGMGGYKKPRGKGEKRAVLSEERKGMEVEKNIRGV